MKRRSFGAAAVAALAVLALFALSATHGQAQDKAEAALKAAMDKETIDGNLKAAIEEYKKLAQNGNKSVAARALVRLGECYEKQGNAEARQAYQQVVSKFADQRDAVAQARARLAAPEHVFQAAPHDCAVRKPAGVARVAGLSCLLDCPRYAFGCGRSAGLLAGSDDHVLWANG